MIGRICDLILGIVTVYSNIETLTRHNSLDKLDANNVLELLLRGQTGTESLAVGGGIKVDRKAVSILLVITKPIAIRRIDKEIVFDFTVAYDLIFTDDVVLRQDHFIDGRKSRGDCCGIAIGVSVHRIKRTDGTTQQFAAIG